MGDALDLEAAREGMTIRQLLRAGGFLSDRRMTAAERRKIEARKRREAERRAQEQRAREQRVRAAVQAHRAPGLRLAVPHTADWAAEMTTFCPLYGAEPKATGARPRGERTRWTWPELRARVETPPAPNLPPEHLPADAPARDREPKAWADGWSPSTFRDDYRKRQNCEGARVLMLDIDGKRGSADRCNAEAAELNPARLRELLALTLPGVAYLAHTTASSTGDTGDRGWCWRVLVPLSRVVNPAEYTGVADLIGARALMGGRLELESDPAWRQPERFYYQPADGELYRWVRFDGGALSPDALLRLK